MVQVKKFVVIEPIITNGKYGYPSFDKVKAKVICYNYQSAHPTHEQLFILEGEEKDVNDFIADSKVTEYTQIEASALGKTWKPKKEQIAYPLKVVDALKELITKKSWSKLSQKSKDILNPDNSEKGVSWKPEFNLDDWL